MMISVYIFVSLVFLFLSKKKFGTIFNIVSIFTFSWTVVSCLACLDMFGLRQPSFFVHCQILIFTINVNIVMLLSMKVNKQQDIQSPSIDRTLNLKVLTLQFLAISLSSVLLLQGVKVLLSTGDFAVLRASFYSIEYADQHLFNLFCRQLPLAIMEGLIIFYTYSAFIQQKLKYLLLACCNVLCVVLVSGGRYEILFFVLVVIMTFINNGGEMTKKTRIWIKKYKRWVIGLALLLLVPGIIITIQARSGSVFNELIIYSSGSLSFLDYIFSRPDLFEIDNRLYGYMTFSVITEPVILILKQLGLTLAKTPSWYFNIHCQPFYNIAINGNPLYFNNNTSILYFLYYDFGRLGSLIGAWVMGGLISYVYNKAKETSTFFNVLYIYIAVGLLLTVMYYRFFGVKALFVILSLWLCCVRIKIGNKIL